MNEFIFWVQAFIVHMHFGLCYRPFITLKLDFVSRLPCPINICSCHYLFLILYICNLDVLILYSFVLMSP